MFISIDHFLRFLCYLKIRSIVYFFLWFITGFCRARSLILSRRIFFYVHQIGFPCFWITCIVWPPDWRMRSLLNLMFCQRLHVYTSYFVSFFFLPFPLFFYLDRRVWLCVVICVYSAFFMELCSCLRTCFTCLSMILVVFFFLARTLSFCTTVRLMSFSVRTFLSQLFRRLLCFYCYVWEL